MEGSSVQKAPEIPPVQTSQVEARQRSQHLETRASTERGSTTTASPSLSKGRPHPEEAEQSQSEDVTEEREAIADILETARQRTPHTEDAPPNPQKDARKRKRLSNSSSTTHRDSPQDSERAVPKRRRYAEDPKEPEGPEEPEEPTDQAMTIPNKKEQIETNDPEVDGLLRQLPFWPSSPAPESETDEGEDQEADERTREKINPVPDIDEWIDDCIRTGKAQSDKQVIEALRCTTMDPDLAQTVLQHLVAGKGIPDDIPGVWTAEDDEHLEGGNARHIERVLEKHGDQYVESRGEYLGLARATGLASTDD